MYKIKAVIAVTYVEAQVKAICQRLLQVYFVTQSRNSMFE